MIWNLIVTLLLCPLVPVQTDWHQDVFYQEINQFRQNPLLYQQNHSGLIVHCSVPLDETYPPLHMDPHLEESSHFQASSMASYECTVITHETCPKDCWQFGSCSFQDRIDWFLRDVRHHNPLEIMTKGMRNPYNIFYQFLQSEPHCNHILNCHINSMGASFVRTDKNIFVADLIYLSSHNS